ncbi:hypothetical protein [endosymbiont GvMRE of Glomus versiforme]|uniref:hypothetical protein n=1 Tax=endosymbiont GvMRE of Glomus versiforme TaxID=2039283 RepID=UPI000ED09CD4|nr:hypothetical protein [endosymbiont GvMRE of Glomus versiforme]RHZ35648.1 hypothetical protein GvMRE_IIg533 [endosymbiont GvMRE of Glomus versiforme]
MANYSYNDLKIEFEDLRENWMPATFPLFQSPPGDNTSDADSKIYSRVEYSQTVNFFSDEQAFNPFCKRVNCYNVNLQHTHAHPETKQEYTKKVVRLLKKWQDKARSDGKLNQAELNQLSKVIELWEKKNPFQAQEKAVREHWNKTVFNVYQPGSDVCLNIVDKLKKEIKDGNLNDLKKGNNQQESGYGKLLFYGGIAVVVVCLIGLIAYKALEIFLNTKKKQKSEKPLT